MAPVGKVSFSNELILSNIQALSFALEEKRPKTIKGIDRIIYEKGLLLVKLILRRLWGKESESMLNPLAIKFWQLKI